MPPFPLHKLDLAKVRSNVEARLIWHTPRSKSLVRIGLRADGGSEKVHPPVCTSRLALIDIEQPQWNLDIAHPQLLRLIQCRHGAEPVCSRVRHEEVIEGSTVRPDLGRVVNKCLIGDIVGVHFELKISLWVVRALVDEGLHDLVHPDVSIGALRRIEIKVYFIAGGELDV